MGKLLSDDKFVISRSSTHYQVSFEDIQSGLVPLAVQADIDSGITGSPGIMYPSDKFIYNNVTGFLDIEFPDALRFIGTITEDGAKPDLPLYTEGDFYIVAPDPDSTTDGKVTVDATDWLGLNPDVALTVELVSGGTGYRADTGNYNGFGTESDEVIATTSEGQGLILDLVVEKGIITSVTISDGGVDYEIGDIIQARLENVTSNAAYFRIKNAISITGVATEIEICNQFGTSTDSTGGNWFLPVTATGTISNMETLPQGGNGSNLQLNANVVNGVLMDVNISGTSGPTGFKDGNVVSIYRKHDLILGDATAKVNITSTGGTDVILNSGDKVIYADASIELFETSYASDSQKWILIRDTLSEQAIFEIIGETNDRNNQMAIFSKRNIVNPNIQELNVYDAFVDAYPDGSINPLTSFSGFFTPEEKYKLSTIEPNATVGKANEIKPGDDLINPYTGVSYHPVIIRKNEVAEGWNYTIDVDEAEEGANGLASMSDKNSIVSEIGNYHHGTSKPVPAGDHYVTSTHHQAEFFLPNNFYILKARNP